MNKQIIDTFDRTALEVYEEIENRLRVELKEKNILKSIMKR